MTFGRHLRQWREGRKVSLAALAQGTYFSKSYLSRVERGLRNPERLVAELADEALNAGGKLVQAWEDEFQRPILNRTPGGGPTKRRAFVKSTALAAGIGLINGECCADPRAEAVARLRDALIPDAPAAPVSLSPTAFARAVTRARRDFAAARYAALADDLAALTHVARGAVDPPSFGLAAQVYHLTTRTLIKLSAAPYAWVAAHRGEQAAEASKDIRALVEARRDLVSLFHRAHDHAKARDLTAATATLIRPHLPSAAPADWGAYGALMATGAIAAARLEDRDSALSMLEEADHAAGRAPKLMLSPGHVTTYRIGVSIILGDAGTAIYHANRVAPEEIPTVERRAGYFTGMAEAYSLWGKTDRAIRALLIAERIAPAELKRPGPHRVIAELLRRDPQSKASGLRGLAHRASVAL